MARTVLFTRTVLSIGAILITGVLLVTSSVAIIPRSAARSASRARLRPSCLRCLRHRPRDNEEHGDHEHQCLEFCHIFGRRMFRWVKDKEKMGENKKKVKILFY